MAKFEEIVAGARDIVTTRRVYGDPYQQDGVTIIPAAAIRGGSCGGREESEAGSCGGGSCMMARPVGAYRIKDGEVSWIPAADTTKVIVMAEVLGIVALLVVRSVLRSRSVAG